MQRSGRVCCYLSQQLLEYLGKLNALAQDFAIYMWLLFSLLVLLRFVALLRLLGSCFCCGMSLVGRRAILRAATPRCRAKENSDWAG